VFALKGDQLAALAFLTGRCALSLDTRAIDYHEHKNCTPPPTCAYPLTKTNCPEVMNYALAHNGGRARAGGGATAFVRERRALFLALAPHPRGSKYKLSARINCSYFFVCVRT